MTSPVSMTLPLDPDKAFNTTPADLTNAAAALRAGELVVFPTETVYGIGANAYDEKAVRRIFAVKGRPPNNPLILHIASSSWLDQVFLIESELTQRRLERLSQLWPGPLTIVATRAPTIPNCVTGDLPTVGVRVPNHPIALALLEQAGVPIAAPSANRSAAISPTLLEHTRRAFGGQIKWYLEGGPCSVGLESTIVLISSATPRILRPGVITLEEIRDTLGEAIDPPSPLEDSNRPLAPGQSIRHYAPTTPLVFLDEYDFTELPEQAGPPQRIGLIAFTPIDLTQFQGKYVVHRLLGQPATNQPAASEPATNRPATYEPGFLTKAGITSKLEASNTLINTLIEEPDLRQAARDLYATLHELDNLSLDLILVARPRVARNSRTALDNSGNSSEREDNDQRSMRLTTAEKGDESVVRVDIGAAILDRLIRAARK